MNNLISIEWDGGKEWIDVLEKHYDEALPWIYKILDGQMNLDMPLEDYNLSFRVWCMLVDHRDPRIFDYFLKAAHMGIFEIDPRFDALTLPDMLYHSWNGNYDGLEELVLNINCDELHRDMALQAMLQLYVDGVYDEDRFNRFIMDKAMSYLFDPETAFNDDVVIPTAFVLGVDQLKIQDYKDLGDSLFDRNLVDPIRITKDGFMAPPIVINPEFTDWDMYKKLMKPQRLCRILDEEFPTAWDCYEDCQTGFMQEQTEVQADTTVLRDAFAKAQERAKDNNIEFPAAPKRKQTSPLDGFFAGLAQALYESESDPSSRFNSNGFKSTKPPHGLKKKKKAKKAKAAKATKAARKAQRK